MGEKWIVIAVFACYVGRVGRGEGDVAVTLRDVGECVQVEGPSLENCVGGLLVDAERDVRDGVFGEFAGDGGDGIVDPGEDCWVTVLVDWVVVSSGGEEGCWRVDVAEVEDLVGCDGEEGGQSGDESAVSGDEVWMGGRGGGPGRGSSHGEVAVLAGNE